MLIQIKNNAVTGTEMCQLKCDATDVLWWATRSSATRLESLFEGKHYCNDYIAKLDRDGSSLLPSSLKSKFKK